MIFWKYAFGFTNLSLNGFFNMFRCIQKLMLSPVGSILEPKSIDITENVSVCRYVSSLHDEILPDNIPLDDLLKAGVQLNEVSSKIYDVQTFQHDYHEEE